jgi:hypothetical protein
MKPEHRAKIAAALTGNANGTGNRGGKRTAEQRARLSAGHRAAMESRGPLSYSAVHKRLRKDRGTPRLCEHCGTTTAKKFEWAFTGAGHTKGAWSADLSQYIRLCTSCHIRFDHREEVMPDVSFQSVLCKPG